MRLDLSFGGLAMHGPGSGGGGGAPTRPFFALSDDVVSVGHSFLSFPQVAALEGTADNGSGAIYDLEARNGWTGDVWLSFLGYGRLAQLWARNGIDRTDTSQAAFAFWFTEFGDIGTGMMFAPNSSEGIAGLQAAFSYAVTMQARGARAIFFMGPHPVEALPGSTDASNLGVCQYTVDWLTARPEITVPVYMLPCLPIVRNWQTYMGGGSVYSDGLHLKQTNNAGPGNSAALAVSYAMRYMMTGVRFTPGGAGVELTQFLSIAYDVCDAYACAGLGGVTTIAPWVGSDPLPSPQMP
ncbi:hypothetical protein [Paracoccus litorisediminis]|uniref:SGNH/GDSL hydrolase family protein n=1 Tax=Paracoccus litorisediminis TaxID=2006130 RepID=A0A844HUV7_9RHOB|nr:hypothetical protein [Paracoccus litorisediminis]MTH62127.1 hypothetical protein [Paracoccus litorisediminis]